MGTEFLSYHRHVTEDDFWRAVGDRLAQLRRKQKATADSIAKNGGPTNKTLQEIESGNIKHIAKLSGYAHALDIDLVDLFRSVLKVDEDDYQSPELQLIIRQFKTADVMGRTSLVQTARLIEERQALLLKVSRGDQPETLTETRREENATAKRPAKK